MRRLVLYIVALVLVLQVLAAPSTPQYSRTTARRNVTTKYTLPANDTESDARAEAIQVKRDTFIYGPSVAGNTSFWPTGSLGDSTVQSQFAALVADGKPQVAAVQKDSAAAAQAVTAVGLILRPLSSLY
jgi:hypothetical protein